MSEIINAAQEQLVTIPIPPPSAHIEPRGGTVLVRMPTNFYLDASPITRDIVVLGTPVQVCIYPQTYTWDTGDDGVIGPTSDPGGPYPVLSTTHTYTAPGTYAVTLTTTYSATITIPGWGTRNVTGTGETVVNVGTLTAATARTKLLAPQSN